LFAQRKTDRTQNKAGGGVHGNAILSRFPVVDSGVIVFRQFYDWTRSKDQPRRGARVAVWADLQIGEGKEIRVYSAHTENFCDGIDRLQQLLQISEHWIESKKCTPVVIGEFV
jgi:endonuclease/exonuclease/phosphatase family metal-dependent hydrolase